MRKNKEELFDKETLEMFERVNKASREETKKELKEVQDKKEERKFIIATILLVLTFIGLFITLHIINTRNYNNAINYCTKNGNSLNYCQNKAM